MRTLGNDRGVATVCAAAAVVALLGLSAVVLALGGVTLTRHRAADAADLAALAAAGAVADGPETACRRAGDVADRMAVRLVSCRFDGWDALVETAADAPSGLGTASAHARAGPVARRAAGERRAGN